MANTFDAKYDGFCRKCLVDFRAGDQVGYNIHDEIVCAQCLKEEEQEAGMDMDDAPSSGWRKK